jgi:phytoene dehydrogenase-like protein
MQSETDRCPFPNGALALEIYRYGCQYVEGGMGRIARDLLTSLVGNGGRVLFRRAAASIEFDGEKVVGVRDEKGQQHRGQVLSALPGDATAQLLPASLRPQLVQRSKRAEEGWGACTLYLAVDERTLPEDHPPFVMAVADPHRPLHDGNSIFISTSPSWDASRAPPGKRAITISTHTEAAKWWSYGDAEYRDRRDAITRTRLDTAERAVPSLAAGIEHVLPGTPRTFERFTRRPLGRVGGVPQTLETANFHSLSHRGEWPGLWHAGDCVFPGQGAVGVTLGAMVAARSIGREVGLSPVR